MYMEIGIESVTQEGQKKITDVAVQIPANQQRHRL